MPDPVSEQMFLVNYSASQNSLGFRINNTIYKLDSFLIPSLHWLLSSVPSSDILSKLNAAQREPFVQQFDHYWPPIGNYEVWAAGVTYKRSEEARERESNNSTIYSRVYGAERPELFMKAVGSDVVGTGQPVGIRADAKWSVPEPELVVVLNSRMEVVGFTIGNDMSSRDIEGENPLYLPQAKVYERSCAVGPYIWLQPGAQAWPEVGIDMTIRRGDAVVFHGETHSSQLHRTLADLVDYLGRAKRFPNGVLLFTGTGIVPPDTFTLQAGDEISIHIDEIGELINTVMVVGTN